MAKSHSPRFLALVEAARRRIRETDVSAVAEQLRRGDDLHLVDVREEREWIRGHLPGAVHLGKGVLERDAETRFPALDAPIVLYCGGGYRSALAADALRQMGYTNVTSMDGGYRGWLEAGHSVVMPSQDD
ncbi:MAG: rhodanese-like domain-containing protein [Rubricoccaceae bacterium]|nr:rhodanese-like domain-containing protein [Rubricoccaceae bacterium]